MRTVLREVVLWPLALVVLFGGLSLTVGLGLVGWTAALLCGWTAVAAMVIARTRSGVPGLLPPDRVTLARALLAAAVTGLVAASLAGSALPVPTVVVLCAVALVLDGVDGRVARRTGTATQLGGRFDGEVDAFLILVLSVAVARDLGGWVLAIGALRYAFLVAGWALPWLAAPLPFRFWRKVVCAVQGIALATALSGLLPHVAALAVVAVALLLLAESFGRDVVWLYRTAAGPRTHRVVRTAATTLAVAVVWGVLVAPDRLDRITPAAFLRIPLEGLVLVVVCLVLPRRPRLVLAAVAGVAVGLLAVVKILDVGFYAQVGRPFDAVLDRSSFGPAIDLVRRSVGDATTDALLVGVGLALLLLLAVTVVATVRVGTAAARQRRRWVTGIAALGLVWTLCATLSVQLTPGGPVASADAAGTVVAQVRSAEASAREQRHLEAALAAKADGTAAAPASGVLSQLRGKDVLVVFVESYGQAAVQGTSFSPGVNAVLRDGTAALTQAGWGARSAFLDSPTFGSFSWMAHATLQSGLQIDSQQKYDQLIRSSRTTLTSAFGQAGWRTVDVSPANEGPWPEGTSFFHYAQLYDRTNLGYRGPGFVFDTMPDQYMLDAFQQRELTPGHAPLMAQLELVSSHAPWTPLPAMVPWDQLGDGSVLGPQPAQSPPADKLLADVNAMRVAYGRTIEYSLTALFSWLTTRVDDDLVVVMVGDHQPAAAIAGDGASHAVPASVLARDPAVLTHIDSWQWQDGLLPGPTAPDWPMNAFRDRFLSAFSTP